MTALQSLKNSFTYTGVVLILEGLLFLLFPHLTTKLLFLKPLQTAQAEQYARAVGLGVGIVGYYYFVAGKYTLIDFYRASMVGRAFALPFIMALIYFCSIEISFLLFGLQDVITAIWSYTSLKAYEKEQTKTRK